MPPKPRSTGRCVTTGVTVRTMSGPRRGIPMPRQPSVSAILRRPYADIRSRPSLPRRRSTGNPAAMTINARGRRCCWSPSTIRWALSISSRATMPSNHLRRLSMRPARRAMPRRRVTAVSCSRRPTVPTAITHGRSKRWLRWSGPAIRYRSAISPRWSGCRTSCFTHISVTGRRSACLPHATVSTWTRYERRRCPMKQPSRKIRSVPFTT